MSLVSNEIVNLQNQTAFAKTSEPASRTSTNDSNMFLTLMLQQLQHQDPTEPTDNTEWLAQLAQYSSLEQMAEMNNGLANCMNYISALYSDVTTNAEITQTLNLVGKEITIKDPDDESNLITGRVSEANFEDGTGKVKVGGKYYSIANIIAVKEPEENNI